MNRLDDATTGTLAPGQVEALLEILGEIRENAEKNSPPE